jgi:hypothetical protein
MAGLGFFDERLQLAGTGVGRNLLILKCLAVFDEPIGNRMNFPGFELCDGRFNFLHRTHDGEGIRSGHVRQAANEAREVLRLD